MKKKKQSEIRLFTSTIQIVLDSPLSWTLIAVQKNGKLTAGLTAGLTADLTIQMSQESSRTDPYYPIFGHIKVLHFLSVFYGLN